MSHFKASQIRFTPDFSKFEVFGDDNNVFPKYNKWTNEIPTEGLLRELDGGTIQLTRSKYPAIHQAVADAKKEFEARFGPLTWDIPNQKSIWHWPYMVQQNQVSQEDILFFAELEKKFIDALKTMHIPKKKAAVTYVAPGTSQIRLL